MIDWIKDVSTGLWMTYIESDYQTNWGYDGICIWVSQPKRLQQPKSSSLISERTMLILTQVMWSICCLERNDFFYKHSNNNWLYKLLLFGFVLTYFDRNFHRNYHHSDSPHHKQGLDGCTTHAKHTKMTGRHVLKWCIKESIKHPRKIPIKKQCVVQKCTHLDL